MKVLKKIVNIEHGCVQWIIKINKTKYTIQEYVDTIKLYSNNKGNITYDEFVQGTRDYEIWKLMLNRL